MKFDPNEPQLAASLGITAKREAQLDDLFDTVIRSLPRQFKLAVMHERIAPFITTPEEAYYAAAFVISFAHNMKHAEMAIFN